MVSHEEVRLERMNTIRASAEEAGDDLNKDKLINVCCAEWGCTRRTVLEYMKVLGI